MVAPFGHARILTRLGFGAARMTASAVRWFSSTRRSRGASSAIQFVQIITPPYAITISAIAWRTAVGQPPPTFAIAATAWPIR